MKHIFTILSFSAIFSSAQAQCTETQKDKILLVGDSWAFFMNFDGTINDVSKSWGHSDIEYYTNLTLSENGAETDDFLLPAKVSELTHQLNTMPDLEAIHLSIGGNDFLGNWNINFSPTKTDSLANAVIGRLDSIVDIIHTTRPDVHIFWSGYVYTNFGEVIGAITPILQSVHPFYGTWEGMGFPSFNQLNSIQNWFLLKIKTHYENDDKFTYIHAPGLMQYEFGQTSALEVTPFGTYAPYTVALPEGDVNYPSPKNTMRDYGVTKDCFHLSAAGYRAFISYHYQKFYHKFFMDDAYTTATFASSGSVNNSGTTSNEIIVGKEGSENTVAIFDLDNTHIDAFAPEKLELFFKIEELSGTNMLEDGSLEVEVIEGNFGSSINLEANDFSSPASMSAVPCIFGDKEAGKWVRLELPTGFNDHVGQSNSQIRLKYTGSTDARLKIVNSSDVDFQATLNIKYGESTASVNDLMAANKLTVYPNPTDGKVIINSVNTPSSIELFSVTGELIQNIEHNGSEVSIEHLPAGIYLMHVEIDNTKQVVRIIKK